LGLPFEALQMDSLYLLEQHIIANPLVATGGIDLHLGYV
jgi:hypothetical protein